MLNKTVVAMEAYLLAQEKSGEVLEVAHDSAEVMQEVKKYRKAGILL